MSDKKRKKGNIKLMNHTQGNDLRKYNRSRKREKITVCLYAREKKYKLRYCNFISIFLSKVVFISI